MSSSLYSRYVPAKKTKEIPLAPNSNSSSGLTTAPSQKAASVITQASATEQDASASYPRYILASSNPIVRDSVTQKYESPEVSVSLKRKRTPVDHGLDDPAPAKKSGQKTMGLSFVPVRSTSEQAPEIESFNLLEGTIANGPSRLGKKDRKRKGKDQERTNGNSDLPRVDEVSSNEAGSKHKSILSKREKSIKKAEKLARKAEQKDARTREGFEDDMPLAEEASELHALEPLPQPDPVQEFIGKSTFSALPPWLASPTRVSPSATSTFAELGIAEPVIESLQSKGFEHAFAVQAALLPLLLPGDQRHQGDILVSAATGSGKTLAYVLPMVTNLCQTSFTRLRGLIVMPTRELVNQAHAVCEICITAVAADGHRRIKIGRAVGNQQLKAEQAALINEGQRFDPVEYRRLEKLANAKWESSSQDSDAEDMSFYDDESTLTLPDHVIEHTSKVDILICTPGRLVEHLKGTIGFSLDFISWLIIDEADKLLDQSFQQWLEVIMPSIAKPSKPAQLIRRDEIVGNRITKVVLSATVTRDLGKLSGLKLYQPKLVVLEGDDNGASTNPDASFALPNSLQESSVKVDNESEKPLYLLEILRVTELIEETRAMPDHNSLDTSSDDSSNERYSHTNKDSSDSDTESDASEAKSQAYDAMLNGALARTRVEVMPDSTRGVLIFTKSNETALRLSRLLTLLEPSLSGKVGTLTSTIQNSIRRKTLSSFQRGKLAIIVASDLVSRGLDIPGLAHVINYDIPTSITSYIHRVGRTARASREGHAWTLYSATEARWFWNEIARSDLVQRAAGKKVNRIKVDAKEFGEERRQAYVEALAILGKEATGVR